MAKKEKQQRLEDPVDLYTLTYDAEADRYHLDCNRIERKALPDDAVHVAGKKRGGKYTRYLVHDLELAPNPMYKPDGHHAMSAVDLYQYMINEDLRSDFQITEAGSLKNLDMKRIMTILIVAVFAVCILYAML